MKSTLTLIIGSLAALSAASPYPPIYVYAKRLPRDIASEIPDGQVQAPTTAASPPPNQPTGKGTPTVITTVTTVCQASTDIWTVWPATTMPGPNIIMTQPTATVINRSQSSYGASSKGISSSSSTSGPVQEPTTDATMTITTVTITATVCTDSTSQEPTEGATSGSVFTTGSGYPPISGSIPSSAAPASTHPMPCPHNGNFCTSYRPRPDHTRTASQALASQIGDGQVEASTKVV